MNIFTKNKYPVVSSQQLFTFIPKHLENHLKNRGHAHLDNYSKKWPSDSSKNLKKKNTLTLQAMCILNVSSFMNLTRKLSLEGDRFFWLERQNCFLFVCFNWYSFLPFTYNSLSLRQGENKKERRTFFSTICLSSKKQDITT